MKPRACELCKGEASIYCDSDTAFLCWNCDARVHQANFLAARHVRRRLHDHRLFSGVASDDVDSDNISSSSSCISTTESAATNAVSFRRRGGKRRRGREEVAEVDARAEGVLANWCRKVGADNNCAVVVAPHALGVGMRKLKSIPFRVCAAAAVLFAANLCGGVGGGGRRGAAGLLRRLEGCSGVPAKVIVLAEAKLSRVVGRCHVDEEGWAECSS